MAELESPSRHRLYGSFTRYSSWTARVVLVLEHFRIPYEAEYFNIFETNDVSPPASFAGCLYPMLQPSLQDAGFVVNDSLAICEYLADAHPGLGLWPKDSKLRALARSAAAQMHSGFTALRDSFPSTFVGRYNGNIPMSNVARQDIESVLLLWGKSRSVTKKRLAELGQDDAGFLFGTFSIADAFFWPVLWRFRSYGLPLVTANDDALKWMSTMWNDPVVKQQSLDMLKQAANPLTRIEKYEELFKGEPSITYSEFDDSWIFEKPQPSN